VLTARQMQLMCSTNLLHNCWKRQYTIQ